MRKETSLRKESLDALLRALDPDPDRAGEKYLALRQRLIVYFVGFGVLEPEELSDETLDRVASRVGEREFGSNAELRSYVLGFARNIRLEYFKKLARNPTLGEPYLPEIDISTTALNAIVEERHECLSLCLDTLDPSDRELILAYYRYSKREGINFRKKIAEREQLSVNALHMRVNRIRGKIKKCILKCLKKKL